ncbi:hypothetical protein CMV_018805 [Castanea mollissima]|uniref:Uncharacterized protein n=1 Tax=Castanea mollissima TaxID=60419 RepID=A0A8J4VHC3_9ROSI|nr:hypothetical protein CMV_018805 [Castanea mollissima]
MISATELWYKDELLGSRAVVLCWREGKDPLSREPLAISNPMEEKASSVGEEVAVIHTHTHRIGVGFANHTGSIPLDWTFGAFIVETMLEPLELEPDLGQIVGNESVTYFLLFAFLLTAVLAMFFVLQWQKPQLKTIYDLEKGRYIVTRVPR